MDAKSLISYYLFMPNLPISPVVILLAVSTIVLVILYLYEYNERKKLQKEGEKVLEEFRNKGLNLLHDSIKKSQEILGDAELEGIKVVTQSEHSTRQAEQEYSSELATSIKQSSETITAAQNEFLAFINELKAKAAHFEDYSQQQTETGISQMFERLETRLSEFLINTEQKTTSSIELEIKATRELIETYKQQQLSLIDENIIAMMEQTLSMVLAKKLSLKDQLDLVYEALERAKVDKFIV